MLGRKFKLSNKLYMEFPIGSGSELKFELLKVHCTSKVFLWDFLAYLKLIIDSKKYLGPELLIFSFLNIDIL